MAGCGSVGSSTNVSASSKLTEEVSDACSTDGSAGTPECAICLQTCIHPVRLPCCHVFCFLCVKGASWLSKRCALCRHEIPEDFLERPVLLSPEELKAAAAGVSRGAGAGRGSCVDFAWYYEGRNGWWQYDERASRELEEAFSKGRKSTEMLIAGFLYVADLESMVQYRRNEHGRKRKIKRDAVDIPKKGVAGLRLDPEPAPAPALPVVPPTAVERVSSADGSDAGMVASLPPFGPPALTGHRLNSSPSSSPPTLEESFSQLLLGQPEGERTEGEDEQQTREYASDGSEREERRDRPAAGSRSTPRRRQRPPRDSQPARGPPRGGTSSSAPSVRSRSPDGQCTVTEV
ncbi:E3 ubiquitin-protein ligase rnf146-like [Brachionichthys hirsutus]|uniref:E3 ubiquitin-protein ligase rnf146-like n=1 Tax=Brachionichthys hirsutus TaxID=412623 RepID=UPI0036049AED